MSGGSIVHVRCGSDIRDALQMARIKGDYFEFSDPVCAGPVAAWDRPEEFLAARIEFLSTLSRRSLPVLDTKTRPSAAQLQALEKQLRAELDVLSHLQDVEQIVLWFEHDPYDQFQLLRFLAQVHSDVTVRYRIRLVLIDHHESVPRFQGLGQLAPQALADLLPHAEPIVDRDFSLAHRGWRDFVDGRIDDLAQRFSSDHIDERSAFRFFERALQRWRADYPESPDEQSLTQRLSLLHLRSGPATAIETFLAVNRTDPLPYLGDAMYFPLLADLARGPDPFITLYESLDQPIELLPRGHAALKN
jgi:hypothetical protein